MNILAQKNRGPSQGTQNKIGFLENSFTDFELHGWIFWKLNGTAPGAPNAHMRQFVQCLGTCFVYVLQETIIGIFCVY